MFTRDKKKWLGIVISFLIISIIVSPYLANAQYPGVGFGEVNDVLKDEKDQIKELDKEEKKEAKDALKEKRKAMKEKAKREKAEIKHKEKEGWNLTFVDNFNGTELDPTKWKHAPEWDRQGGAIQWSDDEAFLNGDGELIIQVSERDGSYYSGAVRTAGLFEQAYGYFEIKADIPREEGMWNAFWLMSPGVHDVGNEGRDGTEIDIFESPYAFSETISQVLHWDGYGADHKSAANFPTIPGLYEGFHTFALEWNPDEYIFYVDGEETWRTDAGGVSQVPAYMKITAEAAGWADGNIENANLPAQMKVDYVRVYERKDK